MRWPLLEDVPEADIQRLLSVARRRRFGRNEVVFHRDDPADSLHLIEKGRVAIRIITPLGDTVTIAVRGPGESFGEMALVGAARRTATVAALEQTETLAVYKDDFEQLRREHPSVDDCCLRSSSAKYESRRATARSALPAGRTASPPPPERADRRRPTTS